MASQIPLADEKLSELSPEKQYEALVTEFIESANARTQSCDLGAISSSLLAAAARFGAFYVASASEGRKDLMADKDDTIARFSSEFKREFAFSLDDYIENYKVYMRDESE